jgi:hypothetical protein
MPATREANEAARQHFQRLFGRREHRVVRSETDRHPADGRPIHCFFAVLLEEPNASPVEVILDDSGNVVEIGAERRALFRPVIVPVPPGVTSAKAVTVNPAVNVLRLGECDTLRETITVTIPPEAGIVPADIYFLSDNTGSMSPAIAAVQAGASAIFSALSSNPGLQFGVGEYQDFVNAGDVAFNNLQPITNNQAAVTAAINSWVAVGGGDGPEAQLFALDQLASLSTIGWRPGVQHIIVWMGDAPGHDPICTAASGIGYGITEASVTTKLVARQVYRPRSQRERRLRIRERSQRRSDKPSGLAQSGLRALWSAGRDSRTGDQDHRCDRWYRGERHRSEHHRQHHHHPVAEPADDQQRASAADGGDCTVRDLHHAAKLRTASRQSTAYADVRCHLQRRG